MALRFRAEVARSLGRLGLPDPVGQLFDWMEDRGGVKAGPSGRTAELFPTRPSPGEATCVSFAAADPARSQAYCRSTDPAVWGRLALFVRTGNDGSHIGLWRDDEGKQRFVHCGSGTGSTWLGVVTDDPVALLRFLAIGYLEPCWDEQFDQTPQEAEPDRQVVPPLAMRTWLGKRFGVRVPARGREIVAVTPKIHDRSSDDPFWQWMQSR